MDLLSVLRSKTGNETKLYYNFSNNDTVGLFTKNIADVYLVATEDGFSPLGASKEFLANDTGWKEIEIKKLADWNRFRNRGVTLVACSSKKKNSILRGFILCPCENSACYQQFATPKYGKPYRDFYYNNPTCDLLINYNRCIKICQVFLMIKSHNKIGGA